MNYNFSKTQHQKICSLRVNSHSNGNLYPHHGHWTIVQIMNINHGGSIDFIVSESCYSFMMSPQARELGKNDSFFYKFVEISYRGNMNTIIIKNSEGRTIMLQHDVTSPRLFTRIHTLCDTKVMAHAYQKTKIGNGCDEGWFSDVNFREIKAAHEITQRVGEEVHRVGGHGGMDAILAWRLIDYHRNGILLIMNVCNAALWSAIIQIIKYSVINQGVPVSYPDFTSGSWKNNKPGMDMQLEKCGDVRFGG